MVVPTTAEINKKQIDLDKHLKKLLDPETGQQKIPSLVTMVRSAIRSSWAISPAKLAYYEMGRVPDTDPSTATKWKMQCECCKEWFKCDEIEVDHIAGNHSFNIVSDFEGYFDNILNIQFKDLQRICKYKCHRIKSHMEKQGFSSMEEACLDKIVIFLIKHVSTEGITKLLTDLGIPPESSAPKRRIQLLAWLTELGLTYDELSYLFESCDYIMRLETKRKKAKRFNITPKDLVHITRWKSFWGSGNVSVKTNLKVLEEKRV